VSVLVLAWVALDIVVFRRELLDGARVLSGLRIDSIR
jgi:hypothetical protein